MLGCVWDGGFSSRLVVLIGFAYETFMLRLSPGFLVWSLWGLMFVLWLLGAVAACGGITFNSF